MKSLKTVTSAAIAIRLLMAGTAFAQRPANIATTTWTPQTNVDVETLVIKDAVRDAWDRVTGKHPVGTRR
jgi:hypothetical protein